MENLKIEILKQELINLIGKAELPIGVIRLILKNISSQIDLLYEDCLKKQQQQLNNKLQQQSKQKKQIDNIIPTDETLVSWEEEKVD